MTAPLPALAPRTSPAPGGKGEKTRRRILDAAITRFALHGFRRTTVADIARDAGLTPAATYAYFESKDALFFAAVDADTAALVERAVDAGTGDTVREQYWTTIAALRENVTQHPLARRVLAGLEPNVAPQLLGLPAIEAARVALVELLVEGQATGEIRADLDPEVFATGLEVLVLSTIMAEIQFASEDDDYTLGVVAVIDAALANPRA